MSSRYVVLVFCLIFINPLFAQEDDGLENKRTRKNNKAKQTVVMGLDLEAGYNSNVFKTPEGNYLDPESGLNNQSEVTSALFLNPDLSIEWLPINKKKKELSLKLDYDSVFYSGDTNVSNANGYNAKIDLSYEIKKNKYAILKKSRKRKKKSVRKFKFGTYVKDHKFNYLHRGTGVLRKTKVSQTEEENRYMYGETAVYFKYVNRVKKKTRLALKLNYQIRDYQEISTFGSYDRNVIKASAKYKRRFTKRWWFSLSDKFTQKDYKTHKANDATGATVAGTLRKYIENGIGGEFIRKSKKTELNIGYKYFTRNDTYADYWSYDQNTIFFNYSYKFNKKYLLEFEYDLANRQYALETNPNGDIRDRTVSDIGLSLENSNSWGDIHYKIELKDQKDKDPYYTYKRNIYSVSYIKYF